MIQPQTLKASIIASIYSIWFVVVITIWAEMTPSLKTMLTNLTGHHWVSKGVLMAVLYVVIIAINFNKGSSTGIKKAFYWLNLSAILGAAILFLFFIWHS